MIYKWNSKLIKRNDQEGTLTSLALYDLYRTNVAHRQ